MMRNRKGKVVPVPEVIVSGAGLRIIKFLVGKPPQTINDLMRASRVTRTAVKEQLNDLESAGLAECTMEHLSGRGRPRRRYGATRAALALLFASNQRLVVPAIWQALEEVGGRELNKKILRRTSRILANYYNARISATEPRQRLQQFVDLLRADGGLLELHSEGQHLALYKRTCPFIAMFDDTRNVCSLDLDMIRSVVGAPVRQAASRHDGEPCCVFELVNGQK
ncbi:MAG: helix-turn-helix transcriptional regulator [Thermoguttaceae bacterium]